MRHLMHRLPLAIAKFMTPPGIRDMIEARIHVRQKISVIPRPKAELGTAKDGKSTSESNFHELRNKPNLPEPEKSAQRPEDEAVLLIIARTQSTQLALTSGHYQEAPDGLLERPAHVRWHVSRQCGVGGLYRSHGPVGHGAF
ncbi:hypothetical protein BKA67DRAFT_653707 [Truncatella angustata]|uniref:Uncharacterized protein n=1 Tax=Truncatella angustata TaxID=152316 RepID=A0A9P8UYI9_9PEZI|nr:uncharacterized protein BKA67DRAFT_653707 [Truncatella angustata]KAH6660533.1 hypothetical protein BKA67DRAFT_653707 [Truncatella angustata]KAH8204402.1 hypothetical protein TruAng_001453 [Truncatella angustata]